jgi:hypothetical protein
MKKVVSILLMLATAITVGQMATPREYLALMILIGLVSVSIFAMMANRS